METSVEVTGKIEIRPIDKKRWHNKQGKESFTRPIKLKALVDEKTMEYATGLSQDEVVKYSDKLGQDLSPQFNSEEPHPFWDSPMATLSLPNNPIFLDPKNPIEFVKIRFAKASRFIANSLKEIEEGLWPEATHIIYDQAEEVEATASKVKIKRDATIKSAQLSDEKLAEIILLIDGKMLRGKSSNTITVEIDKLIERRPKEVLNHINMDLKDRSLQALVIEAVHKSILRKEGHKVFYADFYLGSETKDVADYLKDPENQDLKLRIMKAVSE